MKDIPLFPGLEYLPVRTKIGVLADIEKSAVRKKGRNRVVLTLNLLTRIATEVDGGDVNR